MLIFFWSTVIMFIGTWWNYNQEQFRWSLWWFR